MAPPQLHFAPTEENLALLRAMPLLSRSYVPNLLAWNAHLAGFFGYVKLPGKEPSRVERVTMPDGGTVRLAWSGDAADGQPVVVLLPGINNDSSMGYIRHLMSLVEEEGVGHAAAVDWRGLNGLELTATTGTPRPYCAAMTSDVAAVLDHLRAQLPSSPLFAVGWSMGGGLLLRHMGSRLPSSLPPPSDSIALPTHTRARAHTHRLLDSRCQARRATCACSRAAWPCLRAST